MRRPSVILALAASTRGFAFVVFAGPDRPLEWGVKEVCGIGRLPRMLHAIRVLVDAWRPETIVIEDAAASDFHRGTRSRSLYRAVARLAYRREIILKRYGKALVRDVFAGAGLTTKHDIAKAVAARIPAFAHRLPRPRKAWMSEDHRQPLFDAAALGITYYAERSARRAREDDAGPAGDALA